LDLQSLLYALIQVAHNFGAVAVVGGALLARWPIHLDAAQRPLAWLVLVGWTIQVLSGASFGAVSMAYYGQFPDLHGIAIVALLVKIACVATGFVVTIGWLRHSSEWDEVRRQRSWNLLAALAVTALTAAAFLRWFS